MAFAVAHTLRGILIAVLMLACAGCEVFGALASKVGPARRVEAAYKGLAGQSVAVHVWVEPAVGIDFPALQLDLANSIQSKLQAAQKEEEPDELKATTFPYPPASVVRFQRDHPEVDTQPITELAPRLNVSRLLYVEVQALATRSDLSFDLFRGSATGAIKIVEVAADQSARVVYEESDIRVVFPRNSPREGTPNSDAFKMYRGTVDALSTAIVRRLLEHEVDE